VVIDRGSLDGEKRKGRKRSSKEPVAAKERDRTADLRRGVKKGRAGA